MGKKDANTTSTADAHGSPEILTETRKKSFSNPIRSFRDFKAGEAAKQPTATPTSDGRPLLLATSDSLPSTSSLEQDTFVGMMRDTRGMSPEEVKAFLEQKSQLDEEKYKNDVSRPCEWEDITWMREELQVAWGLSYLSVSPLRCE